MIFALLITLSTLSTRCAVTDSVDLVEVNHVHDSQGNRAFTQLIFWRWHRDESRYHVRAWIMRDPINFINVRRRFPISVSFPDRENSLNRKVFASHFRESWTQFDPERDDAKVHPVNQRHSWNRGGW